MKKIKVELTEEELQIIINVLSVKALSGNLDDEDNALGRKINKAIMKLGEDKWKKEIQ